MIKMKRPVTRMIVVLTLVVCMSMALPGLSASAINIADMTVGVDIGNVKVYSSGTLSACTYSSGTIDSGIVPYIIANDGVYLRGTPKTPGSYSVSFNVTTAEGSEILELNFVVKDARAEDVYLPVATPSPAPAASAAPTNTVPKITKHPTGETVEEGDTAKFIARADNATKHTWRLVSADTTCTYKATEGSYYFPGLEVSGTDTDTLVLSNIPASLNGWCVECKFENANGATFSNGARVTVKSDKVAVTATPKPTATAAPSTSGGNTPAAPEETVKDDTTGTAKTANITTQPKSSQVKKGESVTLNVYATSPNNGTVSYQWYSAPVNDRSKALHIDGASGESYTVTPGADPVYYWAAVWNTKEGVRSEPVYTQVAELSTIPDPTPTPAPTPSPAPADEGSNLLSGNFQLILFGVIGLLALAALIGVVIYLRIESRREDE